MIRMCVQVPFGTVKFELKACRRDLFNSWAEGILAQPDMRKFLEDLGNLRPTTCGRFMAVKRNPIDLAFLGDVAMLTSLTLFGKIFMWWMHWMLRGRD